jgi:hypothetical protein
MIDIAVAKKDYITVQECAKELGLKTSSGALRLLKRNNVWVQNVYEKGKHHGNSVAVVSLVHWRRFLEERSPHVRHEPNSAAAVAADIAAARAAWHNLGK